MACVCGRVFSYDPAIIGSAPLTCECSGELADRFEIVESQIEFWTAAAAEWDALGKPSSATNARPPPLPWPRLWRQSPDDGPTVRWERNVEAPPNVI